MPVFKQLANRFLKELSSLSWPLVGLLAVIYLTLSYVGLTLAGEEALVSGVGQFLYFMAVTGTTVGFGDYSPTTDAGKWIAAFFILPFGVSIFAFLIGKVSTDVMSLCSKRLYGKHTMIQHDHIVIVGYNSYTESLVHQIRKEVGEHQAISLCVSQQAPEKNPFIELGVDYFRADSLSDEDLYARSSVANASKVLIDLNDDGEINLVCMHLAAITSDTCVITAYVKNPMVGRLLEVHCPKVNVIPSLHQQMLVKAALDPGAEEVMRKLVDANHGQTQYATRLPAHMFPMTVEAFSMQLRRIGRATLVGIKQAGDEFPMLNPDYDLHLNGSDEVYYIANQRLSTEEVAACCQ